MSVQSFDSFEAALDFIDNATKEANATLAPEQKALTYGSTWANFGAIIEYGTLIVGKVDTLAEVEASERACGADDAEIADELAQLSDSHESGYLFGRAFSLIEPDGELGSTHRASAWPISNDLYEALVAGFKAEPKSPYVAPRISDELSSELSAAFNAWRTHELAKAAK